MDDLGIWKRGLTPLEVASIYQTGLDGQDLTKASSASGIRLSVSQAGGSVTLTWPAAASGFVLESTAILTPGSAWTAVPGTSANSITISISPENRFYRLRKQ